MLEAVLMGSLVLKGFKPPCKIFPLCTNHFEGFGWFEGVSCPSTFENRKNLKNGVIASFYSYAIRTPSNPSNPSNPLCRSGWALKGGSITTGFQPSTLQNTNRWLVHRA
jgi:hypothetical protein